MPRDPLEEAKRAIEAYTGPGSAPAAGDEAFFFRKINEGLRVQGFSGLSSEEAELLNTPVLEIDQHAGFSAERLRQLDARCVEALKSAYAADTGSSSNRVINEYVDEWKRHTRGIHDRSSRTISGVVQNWYLGGGRQQEKGAARRFLKLGLGCASAVGAITIVIAVSFAVGARFGGGR